LQQSKPPAGSFDMARILVELAQCRDAGAAYLEAGGDLATKHFDYLVENSLGRFAFCVELIQD